MSIGSRLRQLRKANKLSGDKLGELCGVTKGMVSQWESGDTTPPTDRLLELRKHLEFSFDWLLDGDEERRPRDPRIEHVCQVMQSLPAYAVDAGVREIDSLAELVSHIPQPDPTDRPTRTPLAKPPLQPGGGIPFSYKPGDTARTKTGAADKKKLGGEQ